MDIISSQRELAETLLWVPVLCMFGSEPALDTPNLPEDRTAHEDGGGTYDDLDELKPALHPDDPANFLKLCMALRILVKHTLLDHDISEADRLLREYCTELIQVSTIHTYSVIPLNSSFSSMDRVASNQITITPHTSPHSCAILGHYTISGRSCMKG